MSTSTVVAEIDVCVDCLMMLASGELGQGDETAEREHGERMAEAWPSAEGYTLAIACGPDDCDHGFSWSRCGACDSTLGGDRHPVTVFQTA